MKYPQLPAYSTLQPLTLLLLLLLLTSRSKAMPPLGSASGTTPAPPKPPSRKVSCGCPPKSPPLSLWTCGRLLAPTSRTFAFTTKSLTADLCTPCSSDDMVAAVYPAATAVAPAVGEADPADDDEDAGGWLPHPLCIPDYRHASPSPAAHPTWPHPIYPVFLRHLLLAASCGL